MNEYQGREGDIDRPLKISKYFLEINKIANALFRLSLSYCLILIISTAMRLKTQALLATLTYLRAFVWFMN